MSITFQPKSPKSNTTATSFTIGAEIRNEKVTPSGIPASTNPKNRGIAEQEQNGVTTPKREANTLPVKSDFPSKAFRVFSGVKKVRTTPTRKIIKTSNSNTLGTSKIKKRSASVKCVPASN